MGTLNKMGEIRKQGIKKGESLKSLLIQILLGIYKCSTVSN